MTLRRLLWRVETEKNRHPKGNRHGLIGVGCSWWRKRLLEARRDKQPPQYDPWHVSLNSHRNLWGGGRKQDSTPLLIHLVQKIMAFEFLKIQ
jgi:hypothetical protein